MTGERELFKKHVTSESVPEPRVSRWSLDRGEREGTPEGGVGELRRDILRASRSGQSERSGLEGEGREAPPPGVKGPPRALRVRSVCLQHRHHLGTCRVPGIARAAGGAQCGTR